MVIVDGSLSEEDAAAVAETVQSFISSKGTVLKADPWGRRRLAYPINKKSEGYYWVLSFECEPGDIDSIKYQLRVNESIVRWLVTRPERKKATVPAVAVPPVVEAPVVEAPVVEAPVVEAPVVEAPVVEAPVQAEPSEPATGAGE
jgi:small subunit ribosomal protein S6